MLATCSAASTDNQLHRNVVLSAAQSGNLLDSFQHNEQWKRPAGAATSLAFGGKSRYLCIGDKSGAVCLWDLKKKVRVRQFFHEGQPSLQVSLDPTDTYVISLTSQAFRSYKLREGVPANTWTSGNDYLFTKYHVSTLEPSIAAIGTDDGSILLYDINNLQKSVPFFGLRRRHHGSITGVAFSATNDKLLASTSDDGSLQFYDKGSGSLIEELPRIPSGISSLTLNVDGISCAVGTNAGHALVYDLRQTGSPLASINVQGVIKALRFSPPPKQKIATTPATLNKVPQSNPGRQQMEELRRDLDRAIDPHHLTVNHQNVGSTPQENVHQSTLFVDRQIHKTIPSSVASVDPHTSYIGPMDSNDLSELPFNAPHKSLAQYGESSGNNMRTGSHPSEKNTADGSPSRISSTVLPSSPHNLTQPHRTVDTKSVVPSNCEVVTAAPLDIEAIRDVVRDEVEKLQDDLEESLRNLHMDMIRQFHQQSQELNSALSSQLAAMDQLREENQRLREENDFLKRHQKQNQPGELRKNYGNPMGFDD